MPDSLSLEHQPLAASGPAVARIEAHGGFSLVEVVLAIGIVAVGFIAVFGLLPSGLSLFRQAMDASVTAQIAQRILSDAQETDFDVLLKSGTASGSQYYVLPMRYFDDQGSEVKVGNPDSPTAAEKAKALYHVRVRASKPGDADPAKHDDGHFTSLPGPARFNPRSATILTMQIATNPGGKGLAPLVDNATALIDPAMARKEGLPVQNYSVVIARNGYVKP